MLEGKEHGQIETASPALLTAEDVKFRCLILQSAGCGAGGFYAEFGGGSFPHAMLLKLGSCDCCSVWR